MARYVGEFSHIEMINAERKTTGMTRLGFANRDNWVITKIPIHKDSCFRIYLKYLTLKLFISFFNRGCIQFTSDPDSGLPTPEKPLPPPTVTSPFGRIAWRNSRMVTPAFSPSPRNSLLDLLQLSVAFSLKAEAFTKCTEPEYNSRFVQTFESVLLENRQEVISRRLPGDELYLPDEIN